MDIKDVSFVKSTTAMDQLPPPTLPEFALIGRSNVGKSSLINRLVQRKGMAKTSATPGKTRLINHYLINNAFYMVDLPGYGYAKRSQEERKDFDRMIWDYLIRRESLMVLLVLIDIRLEPQKNDLNFIEKLGEHGIPFALAFTKADKLGRTVAASSQARFLRVMKENWEELPPSFLTSAETGDGRDAVLDYLDTILPLYQPTK